MSDAEYTRRPPINPNPRIDVFPQGPRPDPDPTRHNEQVASGRYPTPPPPYVPPQRPAHLSPLLLTSDTKRPFVVNLRDWLSCVVLGLLAAWMLAGTILVLLGALAVGNAFNSINDSPAQQPTINWESPDPLPSNECIGELPCD